MTMSKLLRVLIVEDSEDDALLVIRELRRSNFDLIWERVETAESLRTMLETRPWDMIISDYTLPKLDAPTALAIVKQSQLDIPFITIAGTIGESLAVEMMKAGAHDYVMKQSLARLPEAVRRELRDAQIRAERKQAETALVQSEAKSRAILAAIPDLMFRVGADGVYRGYITQHRDLDVLPQTIDPVGSFIGDVLPAEHAEKHLYYIEQALETQELQVYEQQIQVGDRLRDEEVRVIKSGEDEVLFMIRDISDRKQAERQLQNLIAGTAATTGQDFFPALVWHIAEALQVSYTLVAERVGDKMRSIAFWANGVLQSTYVYPLNETPCEQVLETGKFYCECDLRKRFPNAAVLLDLEAESYLGVALRDTQGNAIGDLCILHQQPIRDPQRAEQILQVFAARAAAELERQRAEVAMRQQLAAIEAAIDGIGILQGDTYLYANQAHLKLFGYECSEELVGQTWKVLYSPEEAERFEREILPILARDRAWQGEAIATRKDGSTFAEGLSLTLTEDGLLICVCRDISELKQVQEQIIHNALHDPLTHLPNRTLLIERLELTIHRAKRSAGHRYAVLFLDLDRFKVVNDSLGHPTGDKLLEVVAQRLQAHLRETDLVARLGGDEFVILLEDISGIESVIQIVERILADCQDSIVIDGHTIFTSFSIGVVLGTEKYHQASNLIRDADIAMYQAKAQEKNSYRFFDVTMHARALKRLTLETDLRKALDREELLVYYQPILNLRDRQLVGFEALVRWQHPTRGLIAPDEFIPVAEETGLIVLLDRWMFNQACQQMARWQNQFAHHFPLKISINLSAQDLCQSSLVRDIDGILAETGFGGDLVTVEITESMLIEDIDRTIDLLAQLSSRNLQISIDDFGTGYSSLNYLHRLPVRYLKIDRSFVSQMQVENRNYQVVNTIVALSNQLGLTVVAEGIETSEQLQQLQQLGCELGQGYLFSRPLAAHAIETDFLNCMCH